MLHGGPGLPSRYLETLELLAGQDRRVIFYDQVMSLQLQYDFEICPDRLSFLSTAAWVFTSLCGLSGREDACMACAG